MNPDSGKLYTPEEVDEMTKEERQELKWISAREFAAMQQIEEEKRPKALSKMRAADAKMRASKRKAQKKARRKNR